MKGPTARASLRHSETKMKIFASAGAGFNWADVDALDRRGIWYCNGAGASDEAVSDTALFMILSVFRNFGGHREGAHPEQFLAMHRLVGSISYNPRGHVLGNVGLGNISKLLAFRAQDSTGNENSLLRRLTLRQYITPTHELLSVADCVTLHTPLNKYTQDFIKKETFAAMKDGTSLVNTARRQVSGKVAAAGLDVHHHEPQVSKELAAMNNVTLACHNGGASITMRINSELNAMKNILQVNGSDGEFSGAPPITPVNEKAFKGSS
ncbi:unnamed protein product, partial [Clonostachys rhizophaga]